MRYIVIFSVFLFTACNFLQTQPEPVPTPTPPTPPVEEEVLEPEPASASGTGAETGTGTGMITGTGAATETGTGEAITGDQESSDADEVSAGDGGYVDAYSDIEIVNAIIGNGDKSLIFFYASWCGFCQAKDVVLESLYSENSYAISTYKVNYDDADDLKARYEVATQDTVVLIDGEGNAEQMLSGATEEDLDMILSSE